MMAGQSSLMAALCCAILCAAVTPTGSSLRAQDVPRPEATHQVAAPLGDQFSKAQANLEMVNLHALRRAIQGLTKAFPTKYAKGEDYLSAVDRFQRSLPQIKQALAHGDKAALKQVEKIIALQGEALLSNPLLNFERLVLIKRKPIGDPRRAEEPDRGIGKFVGMPQQSSWQLHTMPNTDGWDNEICVLAPVRQEGRLTAVYRPPGGRLVSEMDLHFDAEKIMFSMPDSHKFWQIFEIRVDGANLRRVSPADQPDVHNFDSCYKPNAWGLYDMHGNVWEWTRSAYRPYPYRADDGRNSITNVGRKVVRGGSWYDRPERCRSAFRLSYEAWQRVYNVGFRVVIETQPRTERFVKNH